MNFSPIKKNNEIKNIHVALVYNKIIFQQHGKKNVVYDEWEYKKALSDLIGIISDDDISKLKEYMSWNSKLINKLIKEDNKPKDNDQLSLF